GARYASWFDRWVAGRYVGTLTGEDAYRFRCSMLHQGRTSHPGGRYSRIIFVEPGAAPGLLMHNNVLNDALNLDVGRFCRDVCEGALAWRAEAQSTPQYERNLKAFVSRHDNGLPPYIVGVPVIS